MNTQTRTSAPASREQERGVAIVVVLFFAMFAMAFTASALVSSLAVRNQSRYHMAAQRAHDAAESGVHQMVALMHTPAGALYRDGETLQQVIAGTGRSAISYTVHVKPGALDGADNDQDGRVDEPDELDLYEVESTGVAGGIERTVRVTLLARYRDQDTSAATYIHDLATDVTFNGNTFLINGEDHTINGNLSGDIPATGIGLPGDPSLLIGKIRDKAYDNIIGAGGNPSVMEVPELDLRDLIDEGARSADIMLESDTAIKPSAPGEWGTWDSPAILYGTGSVHISGNEGSVGIIIIDGDLTISGAFQHGGLIIVRGAVKFAGGGNKKRLLGSLIVAKSIITDSADLNVSGNIDILYSRDAIRRVMASFASYVILNWRS